MYKQNYSKIYYHIGTKSLSSIMINRGCFLIVELSKFYLQNHSVSLIIMDVVSKTELCSVFYKCGIS